MRIRRRARASWSGTVPEGGGRIALGSGAYEGDFTLHARVEEGDPGTNPEELVGASLAGCFTMSLADVLSSAGHPPDDLQTTAKVHLDQTETGFALTRIELTTVGKVGGVDAERFAAFAEQAEAACPISRALAGTEVTVAARLADA